MRPKGTSETLNRRRARALEELEEGKSVSVLAKAYGVGERSVRRWRQEARQPRKKSERGPGQPPKLSPEQMKALEKELERGAYAHGYVEDYWTLERIGHVIWELYGVRCATSSVWNIMQRLGWSSQKTQRVAIQRNDDKVKKWKRYVWPRIKKVA
jgi:transposase